MEISASLLIKDVVEEKAITIIIFSILLSFVFEYIVAKYELRVKKLNLKKKRI